MALVCFYVLVGATSLREQNPIFDIKIGHISARHIFVRALNGPAAVAREALGAKRAATRDFRLPNGARELEAPF